MNIVQFPTKCKPSSKASAELHALAAELASLDARPLAVTLTGNLAATVRQIAAIHNKHRDKVVADWMQAMPPDGSAA